MAAEGDLVGFTATITRPIPAQHPLLSTLHQTLALLRPREAARVRRDGSQEDTRTSQLLLSRILSGRQLVWALQWCPGSASRSAED